MNSSRSIVLSFVIGAIGIIPAMSAAEPEPTKESRASMAAAHEKLAACMRSDKPMAECRSQKREHAMKMGQHDCSMMEQHDHKDADAASKSSAHEH